MKAFSSFIAVTLLSTQVFALSYSLVSNQASGLQCAEKLSVALSSDKDFMYIAGSHELAEQFNSSANANKTTLIIENIGKGTIVEKTKNNAHGERITEKSNARLTEDSLVLTQEIKYGLLFVDKLKSRLVLNFTAEGMTLTSYRSFDEALSSSSDWASSQTCQYKLIK